MSDEKYDADISAWSGIQGTLLRRIAAGERVNSDAIDWDNIAGEIEDVARREQDRLYGALRTALVHMLKWEVQPSLRSGSWRSAVVKARERMAKIVRDSPTLRSYPNLVLTEAFSSARRIAEAETGLSDLPEACPWTIEQVLDHGCWPDGLEAQ